MWVLQNKPVSSEELLELITAGPFVQSHYPIVFLFLVFSFYYGLQTNNQNKSIFPKTYD